MAGRILMEKFSKEVVARILCLMMISFWTAQAHGDSSVYFSSQQSIQVFANNTATVIFQELSRTGWLACGNPNPNSRDQRRVYWGEEAAELSMIKRGIPNNASSVEVVISRDLQHLHGLAVDWVANNIYFSHDLNTVDVNSYTGKVEVVSSDGRKRKLLLMRLHNVGALAINIVTGHLYFVEGDSIKRCLLDGSQKTNLGLSNPLLEVKGLAIDETTNTIFWTQDFFLDDISYEIRAYDLDNYSNNGSTVPPEDTQQVWHNSRDQALSEITAFNRSLYWTLERHVDSATSFLGSLYHASMEILPVTTPTVLFNDSSIDPQGVCTFFDLTVTSNPCSEADNRCEADALCFALPDGSGGMRGECACPTGLDLNRNNVSCSNVPQRFLLYPHHFSSMMPVSRTELRIVLLDNTTNFINWQLPIDLFSTKTIFIAFDAVHHKVYWTEEDPPAIMRGNIDGSGIEVVINTSISRPESMAIDPYSGNLYWADSELNIISVARVDDPTQRRVLFRGVRHPIGLALDMRRRLMYWSDLDQTYPAVERAHMDGSQRRVISNSQHVQSPTNVAVDADTGNVYWIEQGESFGIQQSTIVKYDGQSTVQLRISNPLPMRALGLAVDENYVYWTDRNSLARSIARADKTTGHNVVLLAADITGLGDLVVVDTLQPPVETGCTGVASTHSVCRICLPSSNPERPTCACPEHLQLDVRDNTTCIDPLPLVYVSNSTHITRLDVTIYTSMTLTQDSFLITEGEGQGEGLSASTPAGDSSGSLVKAMAGDFQGDRIFWIDSIKKKIFSRSLQSNSANSPTSTVISCCLASPEDLAVDWFGRNLYWTDSERGVIEVASLSGGGRSIVARVPKEYGVSRIALDPFGGYLYWGSKTQPKIYRIRMDGSESDSVLIRHFSSPAQTGYEPIQSSGIFGLTLNFTSGSTLRMHWVVRANNSDGSIYHVLSNNLESRNPSNEPHLDDYRLDISMLEARDPSAIQAWGENFVINSVTAPRTMTRGIADYEQNSLFSDLNFQMSSFLYIHHSIQPGEHNCSVHECGGRETLCLVEDGFKGHCQCGPRGVRVNSLCRVPNSFMVLATESSFNYLSLVRRDQIALSEVEFKVHTLPFAPQGQLVDLAYDPINKSLLWVESGSNLSRSVQLSLESDWTTPIAQSTEFDPFAVAFDWMGGHTVVTEQGGFNLKLATPGGQDFGPLLDLGSQGNVLKKPGEVVFDSERSTLYWTFRDVETNLGQELKYLSLSSLSAISTIPLEGRLISNLTFEPLSHSLYWVGHRGGAVSIERYNVTSQEIDRLVVDAEGVEALTAASVDEVIGGVSVPMVYVYWYNRTDKYVYHYGTEGASRLIKWDTSERVVSILAYRDISGGEPDSPVCRGVNRPCSHICLPGASAPTCFCPQYSQLETTPTPQTCSRHSCGPLKFSCGDDSSDCIPSVYFCDGITHCRNGFDENCTCDLATERGCYTDSFLMPSMCYNFSQRCDGNPFCPNREDETKCCRDDRERGCFVRTQLESAPPVWNCLEAEVWCDGVMDCVDAVDESNCSQNTLPPTTLAATTDTEPTPSSNTIPIIASSVVMSVVLVVFVVALILYTFRIFWRKRDEYRVGGHGHHSISYSTHSPQPPRTDSTSDYSSEFSHGTNMTQLGNGGTNSNAQSPLCATSAGVDKAMVATATVGNLNANSAPNHRHSNNNNIIINPPPSPISTIQLQPRHSLALSEDDLSVTFSHGFSEYNPPPPPPCPSINYDNLSGTMSFSVSQNHFPATIAANNAAVTAATAAANGTNNPYHHPYPPPPPTQGGGGGGGVVRPGGSGGRVQNPLHARNPHPYHQQFQQQQQQLQQSVTVGGSGRGGGGSVVSFQLHPLRGGRHGNNDVDDNVDCDDGNTTATDAPPTAPPTSASNNSSSATTPVVVEETSNTATNTTTNHVHYSSFNNGYHYHHHHHHPYHHTHHYAHHNQRHGNSNNINPYSHAHYHTHHQNIAELDPSSLHNNGNASDTDSTVSIATEEGEEGVGDEEDDDDVGGIDNHPDGFRYDSSMPHLPPPGRPPSPVTICSYPPGNLQSPRSSTSSFSDS